MSSELVLTPAFAGRERLLHACRTEIIQADIGSWFYEYGDSRLIV